VKSQWLRDLARNNSVHIRIPKFLGVHFTRYLVYTFYEANIASNVAQNVLQRKRVSV
jgi:hypothetical protein